MSRKIWGVDSSVPVNENLYTCVKNNFGQPQFWGRYLTTTPNVATGLSKEEIAFIRNKGIKILPIYNVFRESVGYGKGQQVARNAVFHARRLGIPKNTVIMANVEHFFNVDAAWIRGYVETLYPTGYRPGFYHDPTKGEFANAYCEAVREYSQVATQSILWSAQPEPGPSKEKNAPRFNPATPNCKANVWLWQYGRDAPKCPIDTNLGDRRLLNVLF